MKTTLQKLEQQIPVVVSNPKYELKVRLEAHRCGTYTRLALSAHEALSRCAASKETSSATQVGSLPSLDQVLRALDKDPGDNDVSVRTAGNQTQTSSPELLSAFQAAKGDLQGYVKQLEELLSAKRPALSSGAAAPRQLVLDGPATPEVVQQVSDSLREKLEAGPYGRIRVSQGPVLIKQGQTEDPDTLYPEDWQPLVEEQPEPLGKPHGQRTPQEQPTAAVAAAASSQDGLAQQQQLEPLAKRYKQPTVGQLQQAASFLVVLNTLQQQQQQQAARKAGPMPEALSGRFAAPAPQHHRMPAPMAAGGRRTLGFGPGVAAHLGRHHRPSTTPKRSHASPLHPITAVCLSPLAAQLGVPAAKKAYKLLPKLFRVPSRVAWTCRLRWMVEVADAMRLLHEGPQPLVHGCITADQVLMSCPKTSYGKRRISGSDNLNSQHSSLSTRSGDSISSSGDSFSHLLGPISSASSSGSYTGLLGLGAGPGGPETDVEELQRLHAQLSMLQPLQDAVSHRLNRPVEWSPPEVLSRGASISTASDVYTFGLFMLQLITGWAGNDPKDDVERIRVVRQGRDYLVSTGRPLDPALLSAAEQACGPARLPQLAVGRQLLQLLGACLNPVPAARPQAASLLAELGQLEELLQRHAGDPAWDGLVDEPFQPPAPEPALGCAATAAAAPRAVAGMPGRRVIPPGYGTNRSSTSQHPGVTAALQRKQC